MTVQTAPAAAPVIDIAHMEHVLTDRLDDAGSWSLLGSLLNQAGRSDAALRSHRRALTINPCDSAIWCNLGTALTARGRHDDAIACQRRSVALNPENAFHTYQSAVALRRTGDFDGTLTALERALRLSPGAAMMVWTRSQIHLQTGDYPTGFADYEARYGIPEYIYRVPTGPKWDGGPLDGKIILITLEQGFGDTLLMARYLPMLKARGAKRVVVECRDELRRLLSGMEGVDAFVRQGAMPPPIYHVHASIMSLPRLFGTTIDRVPEPVRLTIPDDARRKAAELLPPRDGRLRVGIVWSGGQAFPENAIRATTLKRFLRLLDMPGLDVYSLQMGPPEEELRGIDPAPAITALGPHLDDFADTAAVVEQLDLVVMTDSSVAHLTGSLGTPVWNLVQYVPYWIYGFTGETTPWYPSMRLLRQGRDEDWDAVIESARRDLLALAARHRQGR